MIRGLALCGALGVLGSTGPIAHAQRSLGLDVSAWQGNLSTSNWSSFNTTGQRDFVIIRSSRGGTTGEDHRQGGYAAGSNTLYYSRQRYDDPYFIQNITRATKQGMFAGSYHFDRADIVSTTTNSDGSVTDAASTGADEATHFYQMAGPWMRPGYMLPMLDLEAGSNLSTTDLSNWAMAFSDKIVQLAGVRPLVYVNTSYATSEINTSVAAAHPGLVLGRPAGGADPLTTEPPTPTGYANPYGTWQTVYGANPTPWKFWQYSTSGGIGNFSSNLDKDVAHGGIEFVKDYLVPALWLTDDSGDWSEKSKWNSGVVSAQPTIGSGQLSPVGVTWNSGTLPNRPADRLPGEDDTVHNVDGQNDTVVLDRGAANPIITYSSGSTNIRKLFAREALNITGGSLTVNYTPVAESTPMSAQFSGAVSLGGTGALSVHTLQVDATRTFTIGGGALTANKINLASHASTPGKILLNGDFNFNPLADAAAVIANVPGAASSGRIDLGGANRAVNVGDGAAAADLTVSTPVVNGGLTKTGPGTLVLSGANTYAGDTTVEAGKLSLSTAFLANGADVFLTSSGTLDLGFSGMPDKIDSLFIDGVSQLAGTWGRVGSDAQWTSPLITGVGKLEVTKYLAPSDFNEDGVVDATDLGMWSDGFGATGNGSKAMGDANGDLNVDGDDFLVLQSQVTGPLATAASTGVPEPAAAALAAIAAAALACRRRRQAF